MRKKAVSIVAAVALLAVGLLFAPVTFAQSGGTGWSIGTPLTDEREFTGQEAMVTLMGKIEKVEKMRGVKDGMQIRLKAEEGKYTVFLGPKWFVDNQRIKFKAGDEVEVRGKKFRDKIVAQDISKGEWTMKLRADDGMPSWDCCVPKKKM